MSIDALLRWLEATTIATTISENDFLFPSIESLHVLAITLVVGSISIVDLRLIGWSSLDRATHKLMADVLPVTWAAFALAVVTGLLLFTAKAVSYGHNPFFLRKMVLLALAGVNMAVFHALAGRDVERWGNGVASPLAARIAGGLSLVLWIAVVACGRWVGFTLH
jgi:hypothetical protein